MKTDNVAHTNNGTFSGEDLKNVITIYTLQFHNNNNNAKKAELANHRCAIRTNCMTAVMKMRNLPNENVRHFGVLMKVLGTTGHLF